MPIQITSNTDPADHVQALMAKANNTEVQDKQNTPASKEAAVEKPADDKNTEESVPSEEDDNSSTPKPEAANEKRIKQLTKKSSDAERERDYWKRAALEKPADKPADKPKEEFKPLVKPKAEDFEDRDEYIEALAEYKAEQIIEKRLKQKEADEQGRQAKTDEAKVIESWEERQTAARTRYKDYDDVTNNEQIALTPVLTEAILTSELGAELAYFLGKHPEEAKRIGKLPALKQAIEIGKIEKDLSLPEEEEETEGGEQTAKKLKAEDKPAPKPKPKPPTATNGNSSNNVKKDMSGKDIPYQEWKRWRNEQIRQNRR